MVNSIHQGDLLKSLIKAAGYTQQGFADHMGWSRTYLQQIIQRKKITDETLEKVCNALNIDRSVFSPMRQPEKEQFGQESSVTIDNPVLLDAQKKIMQQQELIQRLMQDKIELLQGTYNHAFSEKISSLQRQIKNLEDALLKIHVNPKVAVKR